MRVCNALRLDRAEGLVFLPPKRLVIGKILNFFGRKFKFNIVAASVSGFRTGGFLTVSFGDSGAALGKIRCELRALSFSDGIGLSGFP